MHNIYLDNSATTKMSENVFKVMKKYMIDNYYNPSSIYKEARKSRAAIEKSRKLIAELLNVRDDELFLRLVVLKPIIGH